MDEDLALACDALRAEEVKEAALMVVQDKDLQRVLAVWPMVPRKLLADPLMASKDWRGLWGCVEVDEEALMQMCGLPMGRAPLAFTRAKALRLIYPDGSLHAYGKAALLKLIKDALVGGAGKSGGAGR